MEAINLEFDFSKACQLRDHGKALAHYSSLEADDWVISARQKAMDICKREGECSMDEVQKVLPCPEGRKNAAGSVFDRKTFYCVGFKQSSRTSRRAGIIRVWALKEDVQ